MPSIDAQRERKCSTCIHYGFKSGKGWRWVGCFKKKFWFPDSEEKPGERRACEFWT
jgi:hypothetical protein